MMAIENEGIELPIDDSLDVYVISLGDDANLAAVKLVDQLRQNGLKADKDYMARKMKAQFKAANREHAKYTVVIGEEEIEANKVNIKNMDTGEQTEVAFEKIVDQLVSQLGGK